MRREEQRCILEINRQTTPMVRFRAYPQRISSGLKRGPP